MGESGIVKLETLGQFERLVLAAVCGIKNAYGVPIHAEVERLYGCPVKISSIYGALERLEAKAYDHWRVPEPSQLRGNKRSGITSLHPPGKKPARWGRNSGTFSGNAPANEHTGGQYGSSCSCSDDFAGLDPRVTLLR
jgi:hypothetical protein